MSGLHKQSKNKRDKGAVDMSSSMEPDVPGYAGPKLTVQESDTPWPQDGQEFEIVARRTLAEPGGFLVDFAVTLQARPEGSDDGFVFVARVDCSNGFVHVDGVDRQHDTAPVPSDCRTNLEAAYRWALTYCWDVEGRLTG